MLSRKFDPNYQTIFSVLIATYLPGGPYISQGDNLSFKEYLPLVSHYSFFAIKFRLKLYRSGLSILTHNEGITKIITKLTLLTDIWLLFNVTAPTYQLMYLERSIGLKQ